MLPQGSGFCEFYSSRSVFSTQNKPKSQEKKLHSSSKLSKGEVLNQYMRFTESTCSFSYKVRSTSIYSLQHVYIVK